MYFRQFFDPATSAMSYLLADPAARAAAILDPLGDPCQALVFRALLAEHALDLHLILLTHVHGNALKDIRSTYPDVRTVAGVGPVTGVSVAREGDRLHLGREEIRIIATPGHTFHSVSYLWRDRLFCGDALELGGCAASVEGEGDAGQLFDSVTGRLFALADETLVFPGHDFNGRTVSTIGEERRRNPFFQSLNRDAFTAALRTRDAADRQFRWP